MSDDLMVRMADLMRDTILSVIYILLAGCNAAPSQQPIGEVLSDRAKRICGDAGVKLVDPTWGNFECYPPKATP